MNIVITKTKDKYYLVNSEGVSLNYTISYSDGCISPEPFKTGQFTSINSAQEIPFGKDGKYTLTVVNNITAEVNITSYSIYRDMQLSIIYSIEDLLCDCNSCCSGGCSEHQTECDKSQTLLNRILFYSYNIDSVLNPYVQTVMSANKCLFSDDIICDTNSEIIRGSLKANAKHTKILIAFYYLAMYSNDISYALNSEEAAFIKNKFKYNAITACIRELGIII